MLTDHIHLLLNRRNEQYLQCGKKVVKLFMYIIKHQATKVYEELEVQNQAFLNPLAERSLMFLIIDDCGALGNVPTGEDQSTVFP